MPASGQICATGRTNTPLLANTLTNTRKRKNPQGKKNTKPTRKAGCLHCSQTHVRSQVTSLAKDVWHTCYSAWPTFSGSPFWSVLKVECWSIILWGHQQSSPLLFCFLDATCNRFKGKLRFCHKGSHGIVPMAAVQARGGKIRTAMAEKRRADVLPWGDCGKTSGRRFRI